MRPDQFRFLEFCSTVRRRTTAAKILSTWVRAGRPRGRCVRRAKARRRCRSQTGRCVCVCEGERSGRGAWRRPRRRCTRTVLVLHSPAPPFARLARALRHNKGFLPIIACNDVTCAGIRRHWMAAGPSGAPPRRRKAQRVPRAHAPPISCWRAGDMPAAWSPFYNGVFSVTSDLPGISADRQCHRPEAKTLKRAPGCQGGKAFVIWVQQ